MRKIIHIDCDCFFAAVELRDQPQYQGLPVAVGGKASSRGVLSTCNYEARQFGLHSAMPTSEALRKCPQLILLPHRFEAYKEASEQVRDIFFRYTDLVEPLSLDEAYLDVSCSGKCQGSATLIAQEIRATIEQEVGITASAGIAPNKFLAKIASDWRKPNNQFVITPNQVSDFIKELPVQKINGVGKSTMRKMSALGVETCADLQKLDLHTLVTNFGAFGKRLYDLARGHDDREVRLHRERKSLSVERTFAHDLQSLEECLQAMPVVFDKFNQRFSQLKTDRLPQKQFVKIKFADFSQTTMECTSTEMSESIFLDLVQQAYLRKSMPVRLLGVGVVLRKAESSHQLPLFREQLSHY